MPTQQTEQQRQAAFAAAGMQPAAQSTTPAAPQATPPVQQQPSWFSPQFQQPQQQQMAPQMPPQAPPASTVNVNVGSQQSQSQPKTAAPGANQALAYDPKKNPSVVDLLNSTGADSSKTGRSALAGQLGVQGYDFSAAKNQELAKKYTEYFNKKQGTEVPNDNPRQQMQEEMRESVDAPEEDSLQSLSDQYMSMNPVVKTMYDAIQQELSTPITKQSFKDEFAKLQTEQGIPALNTELMNIKNIMDGTEDDIRTEITKAGGFATESQVQALVGVRNKTLVKQANVLQQQVALKQDYVDQIMQFSQLDRAAVEKQVDRKLGLTEKLANLQTKMTDAAKDNYQKVIDYGKEVGENGYAFLAKTLGADKGQMRIAEKALGLPKGALENSRFTTPLPASKASLPGSVQEYEYAKTQGFKGSFIDYQNEDANRKRSIAKAGVASSGLTPSQINGTVNAIAGAFDGEKIVQSYNTVQEGFQTIKSIGVNTSSPADDIAFIYAFAKIMDPNSVVREGEYNTIQKYAQTWADNFNFKAQRIFSNTNFLSSDAKQKMLNALQPKVDTITSQYKNLEKEYQRQIGDAYAGKPRQITNYAGAGLQEATTTKGKTFDVAAAQAAGYTEQEIKDYIDSH